MKTISKTPLGPGSANGWEENLFENLFFLNPFRGENKMITRSPELLRQVVAACPRVREQCGGGEVIRPYPIITQDGAWEIHPTLKGIDFLFWIPERGSEMEGWSAVTWKTQKGSPTQPPWWASELTGWVRSPEDPGSLKGYIRKLAAQYATADGYVYRPERDGFVWAPDC